MVRLAKKSLLSKARARPDLVRRVLQKVSAEGLLRTVQQVRARLDAPIPMGYSCAGEVLGGAVGTSADLKAGDRVAGCGGRLRHPCRGQRGTPHARIENPRRRLVRGRIVRGDRIDRPRTVCDGPTCSSVTAWSWWGSGCSDSSTAPTRAGGRLRRTRLRSRSRAARRRGRPRVSVETDPRGLVELVREVTGGRGADATLITASALSSDVMIAAPEITRLRGRVVVVGFVGMDFPQKPFYEKELDIVFSMSYGPGRYDGEYEEKGRDYPFSLVQLDGRTRTWRRSFGWSRRARCAPAR